MEPIVVSAACGDRPVFGNDPAYRQSGGRIDHGPIDAGVIKKVYPFLGSDGAGARALLTAF